MAGAALRMRRAASAALRGFYRRQWRAECRRLGGASERGRVVRRTRGRTGDGRTGGRLSGRAGEGARGRGAARGPGGADGREGRRGQTSGGRL